MTVSLDLFDHPGPSIFDQLESVVPEGVLDPVQRKIPGLARHNYLSEQHASNVQTQVAELFCDQRVYIGHTPCS